MFGCDLCWAGITGKHRQSISVCVLLYTHIQYIHDYTWWFVFVLYCLTNARFMMIYWRCIMGFCLQPSVLAPHMWSFHFYPVHQRMHLKPSVWKFAVDTTPTLFISKDESAVKMRDWRLLNRWAVEKRKSPSPSTSITVCGSTVSTGIHNDPGPLMGAEQDPEVCRDDCNVASPSHPGQKLRFKTKS